MGVRLRKSGFGLPSWVEKLENGVEKELLVAERDVDD